MYKYQILHYNMPYLYTHFQLSIWIFLINLHDPQQTIETGYMTELQMIYKH